MNEDVAVIQAYTTDKLGWVAVFIVVPMISFQLDNVKVIFRTYNQETTRFMPHHYCTFNTYEVDS